ncbi:MAG: protein translocase subunit SecF [Clostridia bacterium]|nr:protein translocase subunit SecF [Clostridia bacterium]
MVKFYENRKIYYIISAVLLIAGIVGLFVNGVKLDISFSGGAKITYSYTGDEINATEVEALVKDTLKRDSTVQNATGYQTDDKSLVISLSGTQSLSTEEQTALYDALSKKYANNKIEQGSTTNVEASIGRRFLRNGFIAIAIAAVFMIVWVTLRFKVVSGFTAAATALIALFHDILLVFFVFVLFKIPINDGFIAVVLTILGYSINDTLVIFDRIRENKKLAGNKSISVETLVNKSIQQSLTRTVNTSLMTLAALVLVLIFGWIKGLSSIVNFALPMMVGIISGCYSSSFLAPCIWGSIKKRSK